MSSCICGVATDVEWDATEIGDVVDSLSRGLFLGTQKGGCTQTEIGRGEEEDEGQGVEEEEERVEEEEEEVEVEVEVEGVEEGNKETTPGAGRFDGSGSNFRRDSAAISRSAHTLAGVGHG